MTHAKASGTFVLGREAHYKLVPGSGKCPDRGCGVTGPGGRWPVSESSLQSGEGEGAGEHTGSEDRKLSSCGDGPLGLAFQWRLVSGLSGLRRSETVLLCLGFPEISSFKPLNTQSGDCFAWKVHQAAAVSHSPRSPLSGGQSRLAASAQRLDAPRGRDPSSSAPPPPLPWASAGVGMLSLTLKTDYRPCSLKADYMGRLAGGLAGFTDPGSVSSNASVLPLPAESNLVAGTVALTSGTTCR